MKMPTTNADTPWVRFKWMMPKIAAEIKMATHGFHFCCSKARKIAPRKTISSTTGATKDAVINPIGLVASRLKVSRSSLSQSAKGSNSDKFQSAMI
jgi:hypothetical protein